MEELDNFCGYVRTVDRDDMVMSLRLLSWRAFDEALKPVLCLSVRRYELTPQDLGRLEEAQANGYEIDAIAIENGTVSIWVYDWDQPIEIGGQSIEYEFQELAGEEARFVISVLRTSQEQQYDQIVRLRRQLEVIEKFVSETERRIARKMEHHDKSGKVYRLYAAQLELFARLKNRLRDEE